MFVGQEVTLDLSFAVARARLLGLTAGDWLRDASGEAFAEGVAELPHTGPFGGAGETPGLARVRFIRPQPHDQIMIVPLRWEAAGRTGGLLPVLDADIVLTPAGERTRVALSASYRPPVDWPGAVVGKLVLRDAAAATLSTLLCKIAIRLCLEGQPPDQRRPVTRSGDGDGSG